jgi:hypothetical protein
MPTRLECQRRLGELHRALAADVQADVDVALKVGVLLSAGYPHARIARILRVPASDLVVPLERLKRVAPLLDRDSDP